MAIDKNWATYKVNIGWKEVLSNEVFSKSIIHKLLEETIDKRMSYTNGELKFNE